MPDCPCLAELYLVQLLLRVERKRSWKAAGKAPVDVLWYVKIRCWSYFLASPPMMETSNSLQKLTVLIVVSWIGAQPLARASQTGCLFQTALFTMWAQIRCRTGHKNRVWIPISTFLSCIYKWQKHFVSNDTWSVHQVTWDQKSPFVRLPQVTVIVQVARSYSLSTHLVDSGKVMSGSREGSFSWQRHPLQEIQDISKYLPSWSQAPRHAAYLHLTSS